MTVKLGFITVATHNYKVCEIVSGGCPVEGMLLVSAVHNVYGGIANFRYNSLQTFFLSR